MIIDAHTHMIHEKTVEQLTAMGGNEMKDRLKHIHELAKRRPVAVNVAARVAQVKRNSYDYQLCTPQVDANPFDADKATKLKVARLINDGMARITEESNGVLVCAANIPLDSLEDGGLKEMDRAIKTLGIKAIGITSHIRGKPLDSKQYLPFWQKAVELDVPVYVHPIDAFSPAGRTYEKDFDLAHNFGWPFETVLVLSRLVFSGIMEQYPKLKVVSHHLGGGLIPFMMGRTTETYENERQQEMIGRTLKKPLIEYFKLFYYDTAVGGHAPAMRCTIDTFGVDRIVFATDAPWGPKGGEVRLQQYPGIVKSLGLSARDYEKIMSGNAKKLLKV